MPAASQPPREILIRDKSRILDTVGTEPLAYYIYFDNYYGEIQAWVLYFLVSPNAETTALWNSADYQEIILGIIPPNCSEITEAAKIVLRTYDGDNDGYLTKDEAVKVVRDYFDNVPGITKEVATGASIAYQAHCDIGKSVVQYYNVCQNFVCKQVAGIGTNECTIVGQSCGGTTQYYNICQGGICTQVVGTGQNECSIIGQSCGGGGNNCSTGQVNIFGSCYKTSNVLLVGGAIFLVMMIKK